MSCDFFSGEPSMTKPLMCACLIVCLSGAVARGDSIDDAEAKKRGIPVSQLQVENELKKEKAKAADLEKQIAALQKKIDELQKSTAQPTAPKPAAK
jgi:TolA-binding protein